MKSVLPSFRPVARCWAVELVLFQLHLNAEINENLKTSGSDDLRWQAPSEEGDWHSDDIFAYSRNSSRLQTNQIYGEIERKLSFDCIKDFLNRQWRLSWSSSWSWWLILDGSFFWIFTPTAESSGLDCFQAILWIFTSSQAEQQLKWVKWHSEGWIRPQHKTFNLWFLQKLFFIYKIVFCRTKILLAKLQVGDPHWMSDLLRGVST